LLAPLILVEDFFAGAREMRSSFVRHFARPHDNTAASHQIWDYWYVPGMYTYLRTEPERVLPPPLVEEFRRALQAWTMESLGLSCVSPMRLSLYVDGCGQELHNDSGNGRWGFVYSLTEWDQRRFHGGETLILKDSGYWDSKSLSRPGAGTSFYELVPPRFNQLLLFDDRMIHAVRPLQGTMAPQDGRVVIHGHVLEGPMDVRGALPFEAVQPAVAAALARVRQRLADLGDPYHGCICVRLNVAADGSIRHASTGSDRVYRTAPHAPDPERLPRDLAELFAQLRFAAADGESIVTVPVVLGASL
jgi:hypothetical protein